MTTTTEPATTAAATLHAYDYFDDAIDDSAGTLDLTDGAVSLDELAGLGAAVRPVQDSWGGFALCGTLF